MIYVCVACTCTHWPHLLSIYSGCVVSLQCIRFLNTISEGHSIDQLTANNIVISQIQ